MNAIGGEPAKTTSAGSLDTIKVAFTRRVGGVVNDADELELG